jgi:hypothetical protein
MTDDASFEAEVLRIARHRWPSAENAGSALIEGQERDGVFITEDCVHLIESTTSRRKDKAETDLKKLFALAQHFRRSHSDRAVKCWFVTQYEPTADQRASATEIKNAPPNLFNLVSFAQFQSKLVDSLEYLQNRDRHKFGSIYDPKTGSATTDLKYIEVGLRAEAGYELLSIDRIANELLAGRRYTLLGEFGVGKSMTLRELYRQLAKKHRQRNTPAFPVFLNLREHQGQQEPAEILERHARNIGFPTPSQLVRAWKAGFVTLLIDGFDEVSSSGLQGAWRRLRDARRASMTGVRRLVSESPVETGIAIAGRGNFFDTKEERNEALGQSGRWVDIRLDEFNEDQIRQLVSQLGFDGEIPTWIPARPLLLTTLLARRPDAPGDLKFLSDPAAGWDLLLQEVCNREARIEQGISGENVRGILEALATLARSKGNGLGPIATQDIMAIFQEECGFSPTDEALVVLQRLPGLGRDASGEGDLRSFVDVDFADACRAGDLVRFCIAPFTGTCSQRLQGTKQVIGNTGTSIVSMKLRKTGFSQGHLTAAIKALDKAESAGATRGDLVRLSLDLNIPLQQHIRVEKLLFDEMEIHAGRDDLTMVEFVDCYFKELEISSQVTSLNCPKFVRCLIQTLEGRISDADLPQYSFSECVIEEFPAKAGTTAEVLDLQIPQGARVMIAVLKKLFIRSLSGRKENALHRGLDASHQAKVLPVLNLLRGYGLVTESDRPGDPIWLPNKRLRGRVLQILDSPSTSSDPVLAAARKL